MKKVFVFFVAVLLTALIWAQSPYKMSYQAVIRNSSDVLVTNTLIGMETNIRQGTPTGTIVYTETQTPTTNANGLVSIEIGGGTGFDTINWANGPYFIETKTAVVPPLTTYTITVTSQLLSVPYALHAKTAETITVACATHYVGELYGGGVVFWVDQTGNHGLICSMIDKGVGIWTTASYQSTTVPGGALSDWDGQANTNAIVAQAGAGITYAAGLCNAYTNADYGTGVYSDWYLPSCSELNHLWNNLYQVQKTLDSDGNVATTAITKNYYWSSTEDDDDMAWGIGFFNGTPDFFPKYYGKYVRAVRTF